MVRLDGQWQFFWKKLIDPRDENAFRLPDSNRSDAEPALFAFPYVWNGTNVDGKILSGDGYATFRLRVRLPDGLPDIAVHTNEQSTAYLLFINGRPVGHAGVVGTTAETSIPDTRSTTVYLGPPPADGILDLVMQVSNFHHRNGGIWSGVYLGTHAQIFEFREGIRFRDIFLAGVIFIVGIYHLSLFALRREDRLSMIFALFCISLLLRHLSTGEKLLLDLFPFLPFRLYETVEYVTLFLSPALGLHYIMVLFPGYVHRYIQYAIYAISGALSVFTLFTPVRLFSYTTIPFQPVIVIALLLCCYMIARGLIDRRPHALLVATGVLAMLATSINDIAYTNQWIRSGYLVQYGLLTLILTQTVVISSSFARAFRNVELLSVRLERTNRSYARFVPTPLLEQLGQESITEVQLGDQVQRDLALMFSDIRDFTAMSERMTPEENFNFLNSYLQVVGPVVSKNGGFVDKYIGDAVMALFPTEPEAALRTAIEMQRSIREFNHRRLRESGDPIRVGIGLHFGTVMLGTVGERERMDGTVISDAVNTAARVESLTKAYGAHILLTEDLLKRLPESSQFKIRRIGSAQVKGKSRPLDVFELYDGISDYLIELMDETLPWFEEAVAAYSRQDYETCATLMSQVIQRNPADQAALYLLSEARSRSN